MELREAALGAMLGESRSTLVRAAGPSDQATICNRLINTTDSPRAIIVSFERSVEEWLSDTQQSALDAVAFVSVGESVRSTTATTPTDTTGPAGPGEHVRIDGVADPTDLTTLGLTIQCISRLES